MSTPATPDFNALFAWLQTAPAADLTKQAELTVKPVDMNGTNGEENAARVKAMLPNSVEAANKHVSDDASPQVGAMEPTYATSDSGLDIAIQTVRYGAKAAAEAKDDLTAQVAATVKVAADLKALADRLKAEAAAKPAADTTAKAAAAADPKPAETPTADAALGYATKEAADKAAAAVVAEYTKAAEEAADLVACYQVGFAQATDLLTKAAADGSLDGLMAGGMPPGGPAGPMPGGPMPGGPDAGLPAGPDEMADQGLAGQMQATGVSPEHLAMLIEQLLAKLNGGGTDPMADGGDAGDADAMPKAPADDADKGPVGESDEKKEAAARVRTLKNALPVVRELAKYAAARPNAAIPAPRTKEGQAYRNRSREFFQDLVRYL